MSLASISVIIPTYNSFFTIERALKSVFIQTKQPKEIIIIDDKSTDDTVIKINNIIKEYNGEIKIKLILLDVNSGPAKARNTGWNNSHSDYIAFLDSDDSWNRQKLEIQHSFMQNNPDIKLTGHLMALDLDNKINKEDLYQIDKFENKIIDKRMLLLKNYFTTTSNIMLRKNLELRFDETMKYAEDHYLWLQIVFKYKVSLINLKLGYAYKSYTGVSGLSSNIFLMYAGSLNNFKLFLKQKHINIFTYIFLVQIRTLRLVVAIVRKYILSIFN